MISPNHTTDGMNWLFSRFIQPTGSSLLVIIIHRRSLTAASPHLNSFEEAMSFIACTWSEWLAARNKALPTRNGKRKSAAAQGQCGNCISGRCLSVTCNTIALATHGGRVLFSYHV